MATSQVLNPGPFTNSITACFTQANPTLSNCKPTLGTAFNTNVAHTPYLEQWNLTVQREVMKNTILSLSYVGSHGVHMIVMEDENPPIPTVNPADGHQAFSTVNAAGSIVSNPLISQYFSFLDAQQTYGFSRYNGLQAGLVRRLTNNWQMQLSYTYSRMQS